MSRTCEGRIAIITGASRGIGQAIAMRLAAEGARVAVIGRDAGERDAKLAGTLDETLEKVRSVGGKAIAIRRDIANAALDKREIVAEVEAAFGDAPDILVHSAAAPREFGAGQPTVPFAETSREWFMRGVDLNVWAYWDLIRAMVPGMRRRGAGWLLAISSMQAWPRPLAAENPINAMGGACIYGGTKAFLDRIATGAAVELQADNIAVNNLAPTGAIRTPTSEKAMSAMPESVFEPMETMVEAALALVSGDPKVLTSRIALSLPLLAELGRPVRTLDGEGLFSGWQPEMDDPRKAIPTYLAGH